jgi:hypothetical protein
LWLILKINGRAAVVLPDNVLFEGDAGETNLDIGSKTIPSKTPPISLIRKF